MGETHEPNYLTPAPCTEDSPAFGTKITTGAPYKQGVQALRDELDGLLSDEPTLNSLELASIRALVAYVGYSNGLDECAICSVVEKHFGAKDIQQLHSADYDKVVAFLVDADPRTIAN